MKKFYLTTFLIALSGVLLAQLPVSQTPENKNIVLEEFTGISCVYCPSGHVIAQELSDDNPGDVVLINIHTGGYANPQGPGTDFRTSFGTAIADGSGLAGYPAGTVNRSSFANIDPQGDAGTTALSRADWAAAGNIILGESSYANIALEADIDASSRVITVDVEMFFTSSNAPSSVNLNVALLQSGIEGPQTGASDFNPSNILPNGNYLHNHMLRHLLTGQWGEVISTTTSGTLVSKQYTYTLPADINDVDLVLGKLDIVAFVAEGQQLISTGAHGPITYSNLLNDDGAISNILAPEISCRSTMNVNFDLTNVGTNNITSATIEYGFPGQDTNTYNFTGNISTFDTELITLTNINIPADGGTLYVEVTDINGETDPITSNNTISHSVSISPSVNENQIVVEVTPDNYGSEIAWSIVDENSGAEIFSRDDYTDGNTDTSIDTITLPNESCYKFEITDDYGDGICCDWGNGGYKIQNVSGEDIHTGGEYTASDNFTFGYSSGSSTSILAQGLNDFKIYPNPANAEAVIEFSLNNDEDYNVTVSNILGEILNTRFNAQKGYNKFILDVSEYTNGVYFISVASNNDADIKKLFVIK
jgi:hypothetical protein